MKIDIDIKTHAYMYGVSDMHTRLTVVREDGKGYISLVGKGC